MEMGAVGSSESLCSFSDHTAHIAGGDIKLTSRQTTRRTHAPEKLLHQQGVHTGVTKNFRVTVFSTDKIASNGMAVKLFLLVFPNSST
jgi:hypothetical protein